ncbi:hypothetical protein M427DRAFT_33423 [Gonapodya prolifera JEL478]|uniref:Uncharacterized protein n=1 Tax=Gonapodya prolifera (strain JEL478) TaxID=1344416 RepID=A0A139AB66_GONPJ|nr:hypothetical protein M427DRAFT_33423 [Gonapodya prolifera JEL478]|eukprot:KXS13990.1 hypothetical protein M427DRAFT_33423 [Gonapodya prolifera JEL478]
MLEFSLTIATSTLSLSQPHFVRLQLRAGGKLKWQDKTKAGDPHNNASFKVSLTFGKEEEQSTQDGSEKKEGHGSARITEFPLELTATLFEVAPSTSPEERPSVSIVGEDTLALEPLFQTLASGKRSRQTFTLQKELAQANESPKRRSFFSKAAATPQGSIVVEMRLTGVSAAEVAGMNRLVEEAAERDGEESEQGRVVASRGDNGVTSSAKRGNTREPNAKRSAGPQAVRLSSDNQIKRSSAVSGDSISFTITAYPIEITSPSPWIPTDTSTILLSSLRVGNLLQSVSSARVSVRLENGVANKDVRSTMDASVEDGDAFFDEPILVPLPPNEEASNQPDTSPSSGQTLVFLLQAPTYPKPLARFEFPVRSLSMLQPLNPRAVVLQCGEQGPQLFFNVTLVPHIPPVPQPAVQSPDPGAHAARRLIELVPSALRGVPRGTFSVRAAVVYKGDSYGRRWRTQRSEPADFLEFGGVLRYTYRFSEAGKLSDPDEQFSPASWGRVVCLARRTSAEIASEDTVVRWEKEKTLLFSVDRIPLPELSLVLAIFVKRDPQHGEESLFGTVIFPLSKIPVDYQDGYALEVTGLPVVVVDGAGSERFTSHYNTEAADTQRTCASLSTRLSELDNRAQALIEAADVDVLSKTELVHRYAILARRLRVEMDRSREAEDKVAGMDVGKLKQAAKVPRYKNLIKQQETVIERLEKRIAQGGLERQADIDGGENATKIQEGPATQSQAYLALANENASLKQRLEDVVALKDHTELKLASELSDSRANLDEERQRATILEKELSTLRKPKPGALKSSTASQTDLLSTPPSSSPHRNEADRKPHSKNEGSQSGHTSDTKIPYELLLRAEQAESRVKALEHEMMSATQRHARDLADLKLRFAAASYADELDDSVRCSS